MLCGVKGALTPWTSLSTPWTVLRARTPRTLQAAVDSRFLLAPENRNQHLSMGEWVGPLRHTHPRHRSATKRNR